MDTLQFIKDKYQVDGKYIEIPNIGRDSLGQLFRELGFKVGAEIGVESGVFSETLCREGLELYCVDAWAAYKGYRDHVSQDKIDGFYEATVERLKPFTAHIIRKFSLDAVDDFADGSLDFVYIDGNHEIPWVLDDICAWSKKVRKGGIVAGHDYLVSKRFDTRNHVVPAVHAYVESYRIEPLIILGSKAKVPGQIRDGNRSWLFVK